MLIDGLTLITGSFNFTNQAEHSNAENLLVIHDHREAVRGLRREFSASSGPFGALFLGRKSVGSSQPLAQNAAPPRSTTRSSRKEPRHEVSVSAARHRRCHRLLGTQPFHGQRRGGRPSVQVARSNSLTWCEALYGRSASVSLRRNFRTPSALPAAVSTARNSRR